MGNLRGFKPPATRSAKRQYERALGRIGLLAKPTLRARKKSAAIEAASTGSDRACPYCQREPVILCKSCHNLVFTVDLSDRSELEVTALTVTLNQKLGDDPTFDLDDLGVCACPRPDGQPLPPEGVVQALDHTWACRLTKDPKPLELVDILEDVDFPTNPTPPPRTIDRDRHGRRNTKRVRRGIRSQGISTGNEQHMKAAREILDQIPDMMPVQVLGQLADSQLRPDLPWPTTLTSEGDPVRPEKTPSVAEVDRLLRKHPHLRPMYEASRRVVGAREARRRVKQEVEREES